MSLDAYAPPNADLRTELDDLGSGDFDFGRCLSEAWSDTWANFGLWLGVLIVWGVAAALSVFTLIGVPLLLPVLGWGMTLFFLHMRDRTAEFGDAFAGFGCYGAALGAMLLFFVVSVAFALPGEVLQQIGRRQGAPGLQLLGSLVSLAVTLFITPRLTFAPLLIVDRRLGGAEALSLSWHLTQRVKWKLVGLLFFSIVLALAGFLVLLVGVIPASVMAYLTLVSAYRQVVGGPAARPQG